MIETKRLAMSKWEATKKDAQGLFAFAKNPNVGPRAGWKPHESVEESLEIIKNIFEPNGVYKIVEKSTDKIVGSIGYEPDVTRDGVNSVEIGYSLDENCWGKGYMTEAVKEFLKNIFAETDVEVVAIKTNVENIGSQRVIQKSGFTYEGTVRKAGRDYDGSLRDIKIYSMLREEYDN